MDDKIVRTDDLDRDDADMRDDTEPATSHDIVEGGALGLVGGAVVGGLAGGPVGAVVGAVIGGAASAAGVAAVDRHDHDYARTVAGGEKAAAGQQTGYVPANASSYNRDTAPMGTTTYNRDVASADPNYADTGSVSTNPNYGSGLLASTAYEGYAYDFRNHFDTTYGPMGVTYADYEPAYRYGYDLANDPRYQGQDWNALEPNLRSDWEARQEGSWDKFKDSVRYGWDRVRGRSRAEASADVAAHRADRIGEEANADEDFVDDTRPTRLG